MLAGLGLQSIVTKRCRLHARVTSTIHETPAKIRNSSPLSARITAAGCVYKSHVIAIQAVPKTSHWSNTACSVCVHIHWAMESEIMIFIFAYLPVCVASVVLTSAVPGITYEWTLQTVHRFHRRTAFKDRFIPSGDCGVFSRSPTANQSYGRSNVQTPPLFLLSLSLRVPCETPECCSFRQHWARHKRSPEDGPLEHCNGSNLLTARPRQLSNQDTDYAGVFSRSVRTCSQAWNCSLDQQRSTDNCTEKPGPLVPISAKRVGALRTFDTTPRGWLVWLPQTARDGKATWCLARDYQRWSVQRLWRWTHKHNNHVLSIIPLHRFLHVVRRHFGLFPAVPRKEKKTKRCNRK